MRPLLVKTNAATFGVNIKNPSGDTTKNQFQLQLQVSSLESTLMHI